MTKNNQNKPKFNAIDAVVIILIIACIAGVLYNAFFGNGYKNDPNLEEYRIYFKIDDIKSTSADYFVPGDTVVIKSSGKTLGMLDEIVQRIPAVGAYNANGGEVLYPNVENATIYDATRYLLVGSISVRGIMTETGFLLNGESYIAPNSEFTICTKFIEANIRIISISGK